MIKHAGFIGANYGDNDFVSWVHPADIADAAAEELVANRPAGLHIRYVASDEQTPQQAAAIIGAAIGKLDLQWKTLPKATVLDALKLQGINEGMANAIADLNESMHNGALAEDYLKNKPTFGSRKLTDYAQEFARIYCMEG